MHSPVLSRLEPFLSINQYQHVLVLCPSANRQLPFAPTRYSTAHRAISQGGSSPNLIIRAPKGVPSSHRNTTTLHEYELVVLAPHMLRLSVHLTYMALAALLAMSLFPFPMAHAPGPASLETWSSSSMSVFSPHLAMHTPAKISNDGYLLVARCSTTTVDGARNLPAGQDSQWVCRQRHMLMHWIRHLAAIPPASHAASGILIVYG